jgi:hypothetical protein
MKAFRLSKRTIDLLEKLSKKYEEDKTAVLERLIAERAAVEFKAK